MRTSGATGAGAGALSRIKHHLWSPSTVLKLIWIVTLLWGERYVYQWSILRCRWDQWEAWPVQAEPHHVLLVADPQLVDPHTYPGRPWPFSTLTVMYTDLYLRRSYSILQQSLQPDATIFLGDLFDGGREWGTQESSSPEKRYQKYGTGFWLKEYFRFSKLFLHPWAGGATASRAEPAGRRILASIPGNHDLGFAAGIQPAVKSRFDAYFGPLNRIDVIGNHSFVSLDTVSLSAMDQVDLETGSSGAGDGSAAATASHNIWKPVEDFLLDAKRARGRAIEHTCQTRFNWKDSQPADLLSHDPADALGHSLPQKLESRVRSPDRISSALFPTILLSHVPLFRSGTTSCGPMRERGTAIPLQRGYQYQNVLTPLISTDIVKHLRQEEVTQIYSGDDHDYCEIEHSEFTGRPKEITVKSMSWAMGIRIPGVQLVSLWNPVDCEKVMSGISDQPTPRDTIQNRLCLLPDQLGIFIRYGQVLALTVLLLLVSAVRYNPAASPDPYHEKSEPLLPISERHDQREAPSRRQHHPSSTSSAHSDSNHNQNLSTRKLGAYGQVPASSRTSSPSKSKATSYPDPNDQRYEHAVDDGDEDWGMPSRSSRSAAALSRRKQRPTSRVQYFGRSVWQVAWPVLILYLWLFWRS